LSENVRLVGRTGRAHLRVVDPIRSPVRIPRRPTVVLGLGPRLLGSLALEFAECRSLLGQVESFRRRLNGLE